jgi:hypothetical protein
MGVQKWVSKIGVQNGCPNLVSQKFKKKLHNLRYSNITLTLEVDTAASILHGVKIVQIHNITKKPAKMYVLSLYNLDAM